MGPSSANFSDTTGIGIQRTDAERAAALALHRMAGLKKGDAVVICRAELPGSVLFPAHKVKDIPLSEEEITAQEAAHNSTDIAPIVRRTREVEYPRYLVISRERFLVLDARGGGVGSTAVVKSNRHLTEVSIFPLNPYAGHCLMDKPSVQLAKMTFRKKDPEMVTLHYLNVNAEDNTNGLKPSRYRVKKHQDFAQTLQRHMERFK